MLRESIPHLLSDLCTEVSTYVRLEKMLEEHFSRAYQLQKQDTVGSAHSGWTTMVSAHP